VSHVTQALRFVALGGLGEVGMNCLVVEAHGQLLIVDCGVTFPDHEAGVDLIHPDFDYVLERADQVRGGVLTHGHEDHIGALPYLLRDLERDVPIHGPPYALGLVEERMREADLGRKPRLFETRPRTPFSLGPFEVTPFRVTHSIPDATGLLLRAGSTTVVHTGDFKIEEDPLDGEHFDAELLADAGARGVRLLLSDSTNVEMPGHAGGERPVVSALSRRIAAARGRVVVCMFASNVHRLGAVLELARTHGRRVLLLGRSLQTHARLAQGFRMLPYGNELLVPEAEAQSLPRERLLVIATGSQGEAAAALRRLAHATHRALTLEAGDEVLLSSRIIPGRERQVYAMIDALERRGVRVWTRKDDPELHVSGHACREEQRKMIELTKPRGFIPVHGSLVHLRRHEALARSLGVSETLVVENGAVVEVDPAGMRVAAEIETGRVFIQHGNEVSADVLRERGRMAETGIVVVVLSLDRDNRLRQPPEVIARGVADEVDLDDLGVLDESRAAVARALKTIEPRGGDETVELSAARASRRVFRNALGFRPVVHTVVHRKSP
jgi:ribonuclease J